MSEMINGKILHRIRSQLASLFSDIFFNYPKSVQFESLLYLLDRYYEHELDANGLYARGLVEFEEWQAGVGNLTEAEQQLMMEKNYTGLFCLGRGVVTTASAVLSSQRVHKREPWRKVRRFYYEHGLRLVEGSPLYEDSIVTEMAFYSLLIDQLDDFAGEKRREAFNAQQRFLQKHLLIWLPQFCEELHEVAGTGSVYSSIASLLSGYIQAEPRLLDRFLQVEMA